MDSVKDQVEGQVWGQVEGQVWNQVWGRVRGQVGRQVGRQLGGPGAGPGGGPMISKQGRFIKGLDVWYCEEEVLHNVCGKDAWIDVMQGLERELVQKVFEQLVPQIKREIAK